MSKRKLLSASLWTFIGFGFAQIIRLAGNLILTRLLIPELFGLMAIVTVVRVGVYMCSEIGIKISVIRHEQGEQAHFLNTAWSLQIIRGFFLWLIIALVAFIIAQLQQQSFFPVSSVYAEADLPLVLLITGFISIIQGFESPKLWLAQRHMQLGKVTQIELLSQLSGFAIMIWWAQHSPTIWALVIGGLISATIKGVLSHNTLMREKARSYLAWDKSVIKELFHFGKWLFISAMIGFFATNGDRLILGDLLTTKQLGFYTVAFFIANALTTLLAKLNENVFFPYLSQANREGNKNIKELYYKIRAKQDIFLFTFTGVLYSISPLIINLLYDERYKDSGWMLQILTLSLLSISFTTGKFLLLAQGYSKITTTTAIIKFIGLLFIPISFYYHGIAGAILAIAMIPFLESPIILIALYKNKTLNLIKEFIYIPLFFITCYLCSYFI